MTRYHTHPNTDQLASLAAGALRPRRSASIQAHIDQCEPCTRGSQQLNAIPAILAAATYQPMPDNLSARIESAINHQARQRNAAMPATETGRRVLPARRPRARTGGSWSLPRLPAAATRLAAIVSAAAMAVAASYLVAENVGTSVTRSPSSPPVGAAAPAQQMTPGPAVTYGQPGSRHTIRAVESHTNFVATHLRREAISAVHAAEARQAVAAQPSASTVTSLTGSAADPAPGKPSASRLAGCIGLIAPGRTVLLIDIARYQGKPAAVIVTAATNVKQAEAWVVGSSCSATTKDLLNQAALGNLQPPPA